MTICIAAIHNDNKEPHIVVATDRMITLNMRDGLLRYYETSVHKYFKIGNNLILTAGNVLFSEIKDRIEATIEVVAKDNSINPDEIKHNIEYLKEVVRAALKSLRDEKIQKNILDKYNLTQENVKEMLLLPEGNLNRYTVDILNKVGSEALGVALLLVGFKRNDNNYIPKIYLINELDVYDVSDLGFHVIGSGEVQSIPSLLSFGFEPNKKLEEIIYMVYKAKKLSEDISGVGKETEIMIINKHGKINEVNKQLLDKVLDEESKYIKALINNINLDNLIK